MLFRITQTLNVQIIILSFRCSQNVACIILGYGYDCQKQNVGISTNRTHIAVIPQNQVLIQIKICEMLQNGFPGPSVLQDPRTDCMPPALLELDAAHILTILAATSSQDMGLLHSFSPYMHRWYKQPCSLPNSVHCERKQIPLC